MNIIVSDRMRIIQRYSWNGSHTVYINASIAKSRVEVSGTAVEPVARFENNSCKIRDPNKALLTQEGDDWSEVVIFNQFRISVFPDSVKPNILACTKGQLKGYDYLIPFACGVYTVGSDGKCPGADYMLTKVAAISREQAEIISHYPKVYIRNGARVRSKEEESRTRVGGAPLPDNVARCLENGGAIAFPKTEMVFLNGITVKRSGFMFIKELIVSIGLILAGFFCLIWFGWDWYKLITPVKPQDMAIVGDLWKGEAVNGLATAAPLQRIPLILTGNSYVSTGTVLWGTDVLKTAVVIDGRAETLAAVAYPDNSSRRPLDTGFLPAYADNTIFIRTADFHLLFGEKVRSPDCVKLSNPSVETLIYSPVRNEQYAYACGKRDSVGEMYYGMFCPKPNEEAKVGVLKLPGTRFPKPITSLFTLKQGVNICWALTTYQSEANLARVLSAPTTDHLKAAGYFINAADFQQDPFLPMFPQHVIPLDLDGDGSNELLFWNYDRSLVIAYAGENDDIKFNALPAAEQMRGVSEISSLVIGDVPYGGFPADGFQKILFTGRAGDVWHQYVLRTNVYFPKRGFCLWPKAGGNPQNTYFVDHAGFLSALKNDNGRRAFGGAALFIFLGALAYPRRRKPKVISV